MRHRVHVTGASGCGTTTLGRNLANAWSIPHADSDDYFWVPTDPPYTVKRPVAQRLALMEQMFLGRASWVLSGSLDGWGAPVVSRFTAVVFLIMPASERLARLQERERRRYGSAIEPGGDRFDETQKFLAWAATYDTGDSTHRSLVRHRAWLAQLECPVVEVDASQSPSEVLDETHALLAAL